MMLFLLENQRIRAKSSCKEKTLLAANCSRDMDHFFVENLVVIGVSSYLSYWDLSFEALSLRRL